MTPFAKYMQQVKERLEKATPGPWVRWAKHFSVYAGPVNENSSTTIRGYRQMIAECDEDAPRKLANATLIANAPTDIATLLKTVELMREALELATKDRWEVQSESTGIKYGGSTDLADAALRCLTQLDELAKERGE